MPAKKKTFPVNEGFWLDKITGQTFKKIKDIPLHCKDRCEYWDSPLELQVWQSLCNKYTPAKIKRQVRIEILPKTEPLPRWTWDVDFVVCAGNNQPTIYIEAKGQWLLNCPKDSKLFWNMLCALRFFRYDVYSNLHIVGGANLWQIPNTSINVYHYSQIINQLS